MIALIQEWNDRIAIMLADFMEEKLVELGCDESNIDQFSITIPVYCCQTIRQIRRNGVVLGTVSVSVHGRTFTCHWEPAS